MSQFCTEVYIHTYLLSTSDNKTPAMWLRNMFNHNIIQSLVDFFCTQHNAPTVYQQQGMVFIIRKCYKWLLQCRQIKKRRQNRGRDGINEQNSEQLKSVHVLMLWQFYGKDKCMMGHLYNGYCYGLTAFNARMPRGYYHELLWQCRVQPQPRKSL